LTRIKREDDIPVREKSKEKEKSGKKKKKNKFQAYCNNMSHHIVFVLLSFLCPL